MKRGARLLVILSSTLPLGGCMVSSAASLATMPVRAGAQAADWATVSQDEADRGYGREARKRQAREGREQRKRDRCRDDNC